MIGKKQKALRQLLKRCGTVADKTLPFPKIEDIRRPTLRGLRDEIERIYHRELGGVLRSFPRLHLRSWDIEFDGVAVELDEQLHFNDYRLKTLGSSIYCTLLPHFPLDAYSDYCKHYAEHCYRASRREHTWSTPNSDKQFGPARRGAMQSQKLCRYSCSWLFSVVVTTLNRYHLSRVRIEL